VIHARHQETWEILKPDGRTPSIWLAAKAARLGVDTLAQALRRVSQALRLEGKIPAGERGEDRFVREALCPNPEAAMQIKRHTAWCQLGQNSCPHLGEHGDGWIECRALGSHRQALTAPEVFNVAPNVPKPGTGKGSLSGLLKILGPAALTGLVVWKTKELEIERLRSRTPGTANEQYQLINAILKARRMTYSYDTSKRTFTLPGASIAIKPGGLVEFTDRRGRKTKAKKAELLSELFDFVERLV
jgi:hypothetical protein